MMNQSTRQATDYERRKLCCACGILTIINPLFFLWLLAFKSGFSTFELVCGSAVILPILFSGRFLLRHIACHLEASSATTPNAPRTEEVADFIGEPEFYYAYYELELGDPPSQRLCQLLDAVERQLPGANGAPIVELMVKTSSDTIRGLLRYRLLCHDATAHQRYWSDPIVLKRLAIALHRRKDGFDKCPPALPIEVTTSDWYSELLLR